MKQIKQLPFTYNHMGLWKASSTEDNPTPPALCASALRFLFDIPRGVYTIYATVSAKQPTAKRLQPCYLEFRYGKDGFNFLDIKHPWKGERWEFEPTLYELDSYLVDCGLKLGQKYFVWFEHD